MTIIFILREGLNILSGERLAFFYEFVCNLYYLMIKIIECIVFGHILVPYFNIYDYFFPNQNNRIIDQTINDFNRNT